MEFYRNNEVDDDSSDPYTSDDSSESNFDFDYDELVDNLDDLEPSDEDLNAYAEELIQWMKVISRMVALP